MVNRLKLNEKTVREAENLGRDYQIFDTDVRGFSINMGDAGLGVLAVGVASNIRYGPRKLLFNVASGAAAFGQGWLSVHGMRTTSYIHTTYPLLLPILPHLDVG